jgi:hypothetical protein
MHFVIYVQFLHVGMVDENKAAYLVEHMHLLVPSQLSIAVVGVFQCLLLFGESAVGLKQVRGRAEGAPLLGRHSRCHSLSERSWSCAHHGCIYKP